MPWTPRKLIDGHYTLTAHCNGHLCYHKQEIDLQRLGEKIGFDSDCGHDALTPKLKCTKCGGKDIGIIITPPSQGTVNELKARNAYLKAKGG